MTLCAALGLLWLINSFLDLLQWCGVDVDGFTARHFWDD